MHKKHYVFIHAPIDFERLSQSYAKAGWKLSGGSSPERLRAFVANMSGGASSGGMCIYNLNDGIYLDPKLAIHYECANTPEELRQSFEALMSHHAQEGPSDQPTMSSQT